LTVKCNLNKKAKNDAWKEAGIHGGLMQHVNSKDLWMQLIICIQLQDNLHFIHRQVQPSEQNSVQCHNVLPVVPECWKDGFNWVRVDCMADCLTF
jgi:hypothetical protein